jgi:uracil-DNA glycosylase family 4
MNATAKNARELICFYVEAGVDSLLDEEPVDWLDDRADIAALFEKNRSGSVAVTSASGSDLPPPAAARPQRKSQNRRVDPSPARLMGAGPVLMTARAAAKSAQTLDELRALLESFEGCMLRATATQLVFAAGNPKSRVMFVGEAPGREEDLAGIPFVGRSGKLLDLMMAAIGLDRSKAYIANVVPWRPPGNRTPTPHETAICLPFILRQIELANPDVLVCLGQPSTQTLLGTKDGITRTRGRWFTYHTGSREIRALATFHPAFLLRSPLQKRLAWRDFLALKRALEQ